VYLVRGNYNDAENYFQQALEAAQRYTGRQNEARARLSLGSLYIQRGETDRGLGFVEQALIFYQAGGYRTETSQALLLRGRAYRQKGDYQAALQSFQDQLKLAEQTGDQPQIAYFHNSIGSVLFAQEKYAEARQHFEEGRARYNSLGNQLNEGYALMNLGGVLWKLGNYDDSRKLLQQASEIAKQKQGSFTALQAAIDLVEAENSMNDRKFIDAETKAKQALDLAGAENKGVAVEANNLRGLSQALSGHAAAGLALCQQASDTVSSLTDPLVRARSQLALAEVALIAGDAKRAVESARQAQIFFASSGMTESNWRAWLIAGLASQKILDHANAKLYLKNANDAFSSLEQKWGAETFKTYQARPDIQFYRRQLDQLSASVR
jgi:tetratricopeptide (TPR) repeat protein